MTDGEIVGLFLARDERAIGEARAKYEKAMLRQARNLLFDREDSLEAVNDALLAAWDSIPPQTPSSLGAYLARLVRQISIDRVRKLDAKKRGGGEKPLPLSELCEIASEDGAPESELDKKLLDEAVGAFVSSLSPEERALFISRYYFFDPVNKAASLCGMSVSKAKSMLFRTRKKLREHLEKEGFEL